MTTTATERVTRAEDGFDPMPSRGPGAAVAVTVADTTPGSATIVGIPVFADGDVPERQDFDRATLEQSGFTAVIGETLILPRPDGPTVVELGLGAHAGLDTARMRDAAAAFARASARHSDLAIDVSAIREIEPTALAQAVVEGVLLARYRYQAFVDARVQAPLRALTIVVGPGMLDAATKGARRGEVTSRAVTTARDLCNTPATHLTARRYAEVAQAIGAETGLEVEVFDEDDLARLGCGGLLGVNAGSSEPARMIKLTYRPEGRAATGHLGLVGKGIMYDAGGISLKPSDAMHAAMKLDMSGSAAILGAMSTLRELGLPGCRDRLADVHGQHAVGDGHTARRRAHDPRWQDGRSRQRRRGRPTRDGRCHRHGGRGRGRCDRHRGDPYRGRDAYVRDGRRGDARQLAGYRRPADGGW